MSMPRDAGPWGACGGKAWDDGVFSTIKQVGVYLGYHQNVIYAIQFEYLKSNGKILSSQIHGDTDAADEVVLVCTNTVKYTLFYFCHLPLDSYTLKT